jgi:endonuclease/exonuclease/phosphatase family metal-dependent hydrolase
MLENVSVALPTLVAGLFFVGLVAKNKKTPTQPASLRSLKSIVAGLEASFNQVASAKKTTVQKKAFSKPIKVISLNVNDDARGKIACQNLIEQVIAQDVSIIALQEVPNGKTLREVLKVSLEGRTGGDWRFKRGSSGGSDGLAFFWNAREFTLVGNPEELDEVVSPHDANRVRFPFLATFTSKEGEKIQVLNIHNNRRGDDLRMQEAEFLANFANENEDVIILGDGNWDLLSGTDDGNESFELLQAGLINHVAVYSEEGTLDTNGKYSKSITDLAIVPSWLKATIKVLRKVRGSDHFPILVTLG